ncbi:hypothetical protein I3271_05660 [Photobacterium leiognathi]|uniref:hypothetical protein n=1 Tax=Photobacterium leiognathi TaxID=553611 RepID=UPI001EDE6AD8|nr:hypothetical protein [Photobacterium leiognathi]MCG3884168.1 hypothetical protein [Photobacterium leiognathi]
MKYSAIQAAPNYMFGAFKSRANHYSRFDYKTRQNVCLLTAISHFTKKSGSKCYASVSTILSKFNSICTSFNLNEIRRSTLFTIQKRLSTLGYISIEAEFENSKGKHNRNIELVMTAIEYSFTDVFNLAVRRATSFLNRILDSNRFKSENADKASNDKALGQSGNGKNWTRITNNKSKDLNKNKKERTKTPSGAFYTSRFKKDADQAYQLEQAARNGSISAGGAKKLISLHTKHNVFVKPSFLKFLQYRIFNFAVKPSEARSKVKGYNACNHKFSTKKASQQAAQLQSAARPAHMNNETLSKGNSIRDRIRAKIQAANAKS